MQKKKQSQPNYSLTKKAADTPKPTPKAKTAPKAAADSKYFEVGKGKNMLTGWPDSGF